MASIVKEIRRTELVVLDEEGKRRAIVDYNTVDDDAIVQASFDVGHDKTFDSEWNIYLTGNELEMPG